MNTLPYSIVQRKSYRKSASKEWISNYYIRFRINGKLKYVNLNTKDKREADIRAIQAYAKESVNKQPAYSRNSLKSYLKRNNWFSPTENPLFVESKYKISGSHMGYHATKRLTFSLNYVFEELDDEIGRLPYQSISKKDVKAFRDRLLTSKDKKGNPITASRINRIFSALSDVYNYIIGSEGESLTNPFDKTAVKRVKESDPRAKFVFEPTEIKRMLDTDLLKRIKDVEITLGEGTTRPYHYDKNWWASFLDSPHYKLLSFMALTGLRRNEACALTKGAFDKRTGRIVKIREAFKAPPSIERMKNWLDGNQEYQIIGLPKTEKERTIILCDKAYYIIKPLLDECDKDTDIVFVTKRGDGNYRNLYHLYYGQYRPFYHAFFEIFCRNFNILVPDDEVVSTHCLRTSLNTNLLKYADSEVKESWIAAYMGWLTETLTRTQSRHYTQFGLEQMWEVANAINKIYTGQPMLFAPFEKEQRDISVETIEAEIREQPETLAYLNLKSLFMELHLRIANFSTLGYEGKVVRNAFRHFINRTQGFLDKTTTEELRLLVYDGILGLDNGLSMCERNFPKEAATLKELIEKLYQASGISINP